MSKAITLPVNRRQFQSGPEPTPWLWPAVVAVASGPFVLTAIGLSIAALRPPPRPVAEMVAVPVTIPAVAPEPAPDSVEEAAAEPLCIAITESVASAGGEPAQLTIVPAEPNRPAPARTARCERFGTAIDFVRSPALAFDRAAREQKLVMVLHLAGYFDDPGFT